MGGSGVKIAAFDSSGNEIAASYEEYSHVYPQPGWVEYDMEHQWRCLKRAIKRLSAMDAIKKDQPSSLGISVAAEAIVPVDKNGKAIYRSIASTDPRGSEQIKWWEERIGSERLYKITGQPLDGIYSLFRILWFKHNKPEVFDKAWKFLLWGDYLMMKLGVSPILEYTNAIRTMAFDYRKKTWSDEILSIAEISSDAFAPIQPPGTIVGYISSKVAKELGLRKDLLIVAGSTDSTSAAVGAGIAASEMACICTGSFEVFQVAHLLPQTSEHLYDGFYTINNYVFPDLYLVKGANHAAGSLLRWYRDTLATEEKKIAKDQGINVFSLITNTMSKCPSSAMVLPHFNGRFSPERDIHAKGAIIGLKIGIKRNDIARAIIEGTCYELRQIVEGLDHEGLYFNELRCVGGGARSEEWMQIKADVLGRSVKTMKVDESGCLGAAILAASATHHFQSITEAMKAMTHTEKTYEPDNSQMKLYNELYELYKELNEKLAPLNRML